MHADELAALSADLKDRINENSVADAAESQAHRWHMGISIIGNECLRATWYSFRWFSNRTLRGHQARLFQRGHDEEIKIVALLRRFGFTVYDRDPDTGEQFIYSAVHGHYGGSCDGIVSHPALFGGSHVLLEMKTHNTKSFSDIVTKGVQESKPAHFIQMCGYGKGLQLDYALYFPVNKNDDDINPALVRLDRDVADRMELRAESLILAREPPARISNKATDYRCKMCDHFGVCHKKAMPPVHCRSCAHSRPVDNGEWACGVHNAVIPRDVVRAGCPQHERLAI